MHFPLYVLVCCVWVQIMYKFAAHAAVAPVCSALKQLLRCRVRRVFYIFIIIKKMWTEWASSSFRTDARLKQRGFVVVVVVDIAAAAETREDPSSSQK